MYDNQINIKLIIPVKLFLLHIILDIFYLLYLYQKDLYLALQVKPLLKKELFGCQYSLILSIIKLYKIYFYSIIVVTSSKSIRINPETNLLKIIYNSIFKNQVYLIFKYIV